MPRFKTTEGILKDSKEYFDENWFDSYIVQFPEKKNWDHSRELQIEDIDIWEVLFERNNDIGIYVAWLPFTEFYLIKHFNFNGFGFFLETYYGIDAAEQMIKRSKELGISLIPNKVWIEQDVYSDMVAQKHKKRLII